MVKLLQDLKKHLRKLFMLPIIGMWLTPLRRLIGYKICGIITAVIIVAWFFLFLITKKGRTKTDDKLSSSGISRVQEELNEIEKKLKHVITVVRESRIGQKGPKQSTAFGDAAPYILPWYMIIGKKGCGKTTLLMESGLPINSVLSGGKITDVTVKRGIQINPTENCDCFLAEEAVILDTTGRYFLSDDELNKEDKEEWLGFLNLLKKYRPQKPIDGILLAVDVSILLSANDDRIKEESKKTRVCIDEVIEQLGIRCPIYLVFTKCDSLYGFAQFFEGLEDDKRNQIWGYTVSVNEQGRAEAVFEKACEQLEQPLNAFRMMMLAKDTTNPQNRREIVVFPLQFTKAYKKLTLFVSTLFQTNPYKANIPEPMLRGFYFSSGAQKPKDEPIDLVIKHLDKAEEFDLAKADTLRPPGAPKETKGYFIKDIFTKVIIPDQDLDKPPVSGWTRILHIASFVAPIVVFMVLVISITVSYFRNEGLLVDAQKAAIKVKNINPDTSAGEILSRLDGLRQQIIKLEGFTFLWRGERNNMLDNIAKPYRRSDFKYITNIQVNVLKADYTPIVGAIVYPGNSKHRSVSTNKEGLANAEIADSRGEQKLTIELPKDLKLPNKNKTISFQIENNSISVSGDGVQGGIENDRPYINAFF